MNQSKYLFNNEAIGAIAISSVLQKCGELSYAKAMLILPFLFHEDSTTFLKRANAIVRSSEEFIIKKVSQFSNFNDRYYSLLPISVNSLMILREIGSIYIEADKIVNRYPQKINFNARNLGKRANNIIKASERLSELLLAENESSLYLKLRIQL